VLSVQQNVLRGRKLPRALSLVVRPAEGLIAMKRARELDVRPGCVLFLEITDRRSVIL
jgi:hypothetical protein